MVSSLKLQALKQQCKAEIAVTWQGTNSFHAWPIMSRTSSCFPGHFSPDTASDGSEGPPFHCCSLLAQ